MLTNEELQSLRTLGNEAEAAADEIDRLRATVDALTNAWNKRNVQDASSTRGRFAGWFREERSSMAYRLWEQGGYEPGPGDVALYEA